MSGEMILEILGSGGASTIPKIMCACRICEEAREKGYPYKRTGPSVFLHGPNILFDTPEESKYQLERAKIHAINACFYSHWHPDHTAGYRLWECNKNHRQLPGFKRTTPIYLAENVAETFTIRQALTEKFAFLEKNNFIKTHVLPLGGSVQISDVTIKPFQLFESYAVGFDIRANNKKILLILDETFGWKVPQEFVDYDLVILPIGIHEFHPLTRERVIPLEHPILKTEPNFEYTLGLIRDLKAKKTVLAHFEENDQLSYGDLSKLQADLAMKNYIVEMATDGMKIKI
jgi:phosphoribosyl 1,2-cyclic phosphate phosphodiesterase